MSSPDSSPSKATVYIPAYNVAEFLPRCLEGVLEQTPPADEILVIDDGSRDASAEIAAKYPGVTLIRHETNRGLAAARNTAMRAARNELVASLDADCVPAPDWLVQLANRLQDSSVVSVAGKLTEGVQDTLADRWRAVHMPQHWGDAEIRNPRFLFGCNNLFRKSAVLATGGYDESMRTNGEDVDLCRRLREKGWNFLYVPSARATHLRHDTTRSVLETSWRWWRTGVNAYAGGVRLRSVLGHAIQVHFRYNFMERFLADLRARRWSLAAFDFFVLAYFPWRDFRLWREWKKSQRT